ncbi:pyruvate kinase [Gammaproteobacteria bacterium]|nr:pyruvate kinase [Gammaproteobacteria bacterium]
MTNRKKLRKTKVIATIGPACDSTARLIEMIEAGMNVARLNMSHGDEASHAAVVARVRAAADACGTTVALMLDTRGREIRSGKVENDQVLLDAGQSFTLYADERIGDETGVSISLQSLHRHAEPGHRVLVDDGQIELRVVTVESGQVHCLIESGGVLRNNKGVNLPDTAAALDDIDYDTARELKFAVTQQVDYIAASFVRNAGEVSQIEAQLAELGAEIPLIAKIENREGVNNIEEIIDAANGVMVARGDLGVELSMSEGPTIQKRIIRATVANGKPVITATQMLDSMERNPRPTRAEASDVANAIFDGSSAVMLSGETASGSRPVEAVRTMVNLALDAEQSLREFGTLQQIKPHPSNNVTEAVAQAAITMANHLNSATIIVMTETGFTARLVSKYRPDCPIIAITFTSEVMHRLTLSWGIYSFLYNGSDSDEERLAFAIDTAKRIGQVESGDVVILITGPSRQAGSTNMLQALTVD